MKYEVNASAMSEVEDDEDGNELLLLLLEMFARWGRVMGPSRASQVGCINAKAKRRHSPFISPNRKQRKLTVDRYVTLGPNSSNQIIDLELTPMRASCPRSPLQLHSLAFSLLGFVFSLLGLACG